MSEESTWIKWGLGQYITQLCTVCLENINAILPVVCVQVTITILITITFHYVSFFFARSTNIRWQKIFIYQLIAKSNRIHIPAQQSHYNFSLLHCWYIYANTVWYGSSLQHPNLLLVCTFLLRFNVLCRPMCKGGSRNTQLLLKFFESSLKEQTIFCQISSSFFG